MSKAGLYIQKGWKGPMMFYRFKCKKHGWVLNYEQGYDKILRCPLCHWEEYG